MWFAKLFIAMCLKVLELPDLTFCVGTNICHCITDRTNISFNEHPFKFKKQLIELLLIPDCFTAYLHSRAPVPFHVFIFNLSFVPLCVTQSVQAVFRSLASLEKTVEKCHIGLDEKKNRLTFTLHCKHGISFASLSLFFTWVISKELHHIYTVTHVEFIVAHHAFIALSSMCLCI